VAAVIPFDSVAIFGGRRHWRYRMPAAAVCLVIAVVSFFVAAATTEY
jgi:hypothetical protein